MKLRILVLFVLFFLFVVSSYAVKPVHCLGNGDYCVYEDGININQVFGPPYSTPSLFSSLILTPEISVETKRESGTAIYVHTLYRKGEKIGTITDFVCSRLACFCRVADLSEAVTFSFTARDLGRSQAGRVSISDYPVHIAKYSVNTSMLVSVSPGAFVYADYPSPFGMNHQVLTTGTVSLSAKESGANEFVLNFGKGHGMLCLIGGPSYEELNDHIEEFFSHSTEDLLSQTREYWNNFTRQRTNFPRNIGVDNPDKSQLLQAIDDVSVLLKTQQGKEGGVLAGHNYHLAYIRDEYGVSRAFLALGYDDQARQILNFYFNCWKQYGCIHNAQAIGIPGIFHKHENDEVEITGYILIQAFDYFSKTKNSDFINTIMPFLEWCWDVQKKNLVDGMLPFNGDETYVAGGMVSRKALNDGSSEATLLFIEGGRRFLEYARSCGYGKKQWLDQNFATLEHTISTYRKNFMHNGRLVVNNPERSKHCDFPEYRYGVCLYPGHGGYRGILKHFKGSLYFCKECYGKADNKIEPEIPEEFFLPSVYLMPIYIGSTLFTKAEKETMLNELVELYQKTGQITINQKDQRLLGYDYGLFLYALTEFNHPLAREIYHKMMSLRDKTGTWCEYYKDGIPNGCQYRPWESGINIEAAINYIFK